MNLVVLRGHLCRPPESRLLPSGDTVTNYELRISRPEGERAETVPVSWLAAPATAADLEAEEEVVVVGRVRRRFFRAGGVTASRTEVVAERVVPARQRARASRVVAGALAAADEDLAAAG